MMTEETQQPLKEGERSLQQPPTMIFTTTIPKRKFWQVGVFTLALMVVISSCCHKKKDETPMVTPTKASPQRLLLLENEESEQAFVVKLAKKLKPAKLQLYDHHMEEVEQVEVSTKSTLPKLKPHQFLHLHHMKTGGTSMDHMMRCAMDRLQGTSLKSRISKKEPSETSNAPILYDIPYYNIHECSRTRFKECLDNSDSKCRPFMQEAAVMSYCAPLTHLKEFGWNEWGLEGDMDLARGENDGNVTSSSFVESPVYADERIRAFTVLRHPVERVWSMFRFQTRICYKCMELTEIYERIDTNDTLVERPDGSHHTFDDLCLDQLRNHEVANLLTSSHWPKHPQDEETQNAMVAEAIQNMKQYFTVIGLTEELEETRKILGHVFPWMNETLEGYEETCPLPHDNSSPSNNRCVKNGIGKMDSHWELPKHPDEATRQAILAHNHMDMKLYEAAVEYFQLQKRALEWSEQES
jgi:hypothetical protein